MGTRCVIAPDALTLGHAGRSTSRCSSRWRASDRTGASWACSERCLLPTCCCESRAQVTVVACVASWRWLRAQAATHGPVRRAQCADTCNEAPRGRDMAAIWSASFLGTRNGASLGRAKPPLLPPSACAAPHSTTCTRTHPLTRKNGPPCCRCGGHRRSPAHGAGRRRALGACACSCAPARLCAPRARECSARASASPMGAACLRWCSQGNGDLTMSCCAPLVRSTKARPTSRWSSARSTANSRNAPSSQPVLSKSSPGGP